MKAVKNFVLAVIFVSALALNTYAGDMETPGSPTPPPPQNHSMTVSTTDENPSGTEVNSEAYEASEMFYDAFLAVLSLF